MTLRALLLSTVFALTGGTECTAQADFGRAMQAVRDGNPGFAVTEFTKLAEQEDPQAQVNLAILLARGVGTPQDEAAAFYWAWRARLAGERRKAPDVVEYLERRLDEKTRNGVAGRLEKDLAELAEAGNKDAFLGVSLSLLEVREPSKPKDALVWAILAAALNVENAQFVREVIARSLTEQDRLDAQRRAGKQFNAWCKTAPATATENFCGTSALSN